MARALPGYELRMTHHVSWINCASSDTQYSIPVTGYALLVLDKLRILRNPALHSGLRVTHYSSWINCASSDTQHSIPVTGYALLVLDKLRILRHPVLHSGYGLRITRPG